MTVSILVGPMPEARAGAARGRRRRRDERIRAVVDVEQHALRPLEHHVLAARRSRRAPAGRVVDVGAQLVREREVVRRRSRRRRAPRRPARSAAARARRSGARAAPGTARGAADRRPAGRCAPPCSRRSGRSPCAWCRWCSRGARRAADRSRGDTAASGARARRRPDSAGARGIPAPGSARTSSTSTVGSTTIPSPSTQVTPARNTPDGISRVTCFLPSTTSVWPALAPPAQRTTMWARSVSRSTILPFPSSPHCAPTTMTTAM